MYRKFEIHDGSPNNRGSGLAHVNLVSTAPEGSTSYSKRDACPLIHTLVATAFVPNPENYRYIRFKDGDKRNLKASNLEWTIRPQEYHPNKRNWAQQLIRTVDTTELDQQLDALNQDLDTLRDLRERVCIERIYRRTGLRPGNIVRRANHAVELPDGRFVSNTKKELSGCIGGKRRNPEIAGIYEVQFTGHSEVFYAKPIYWAYGENRHGDFPFWFEPPWFGENTRIEAEQRWIAIDGRRYLKIADAFDADALRKILIHPDDVPPEILEEARIFRLNRPRKQTPAPAARVL